MRKNEKEECAMPQQEKRFTAHRVDAQFEQFAQAALPPPDTPNKHVVESLQTMYGEQMQQEQQSIERMRQRLSLSVAWRQQEKQDVPDERKPAVYEVAKVPEKRVPARLARLSRPWLRVLEQGLAALLVLAIVTGWLALSHLLRSSSGSPAVFSDASARPLGAPISTTQGNFTGVEEWSPDGRTFVSLQVNTQMRELEAHILDVAGGHAPIYRVQRVLDPSWIPALDLYDPFEILMGRYLLAVRAQGKNLATMEIWDITGQRAITTQTIPAQIGRGGQVLSPWIVPSENEQKLAVFSPDGKVTIWDVASGQKPVTCVGRASYSIRTGPPTIKWYNHGQYLLFLDRRSGQLEVWNAATGMRLFSLNDAGKTSIEPLVSPDNKYLALSVGHQQTAGASTSYHADMLEILDAHSGQVLQSYYLNVPSNTAASFVWLADSQRLLMTYTHDSSPGASSSYPQAQIYSWNVFTVQRMFVTSFSQAEFNMTTPDGRYLILGGPDGRTMEIWQTSNGHKVATVATPGVYARSDSFFYINNQQMVIGEKGNFDIWDIATGKLMYKYHGSTPFSIDGVNGSLVFWSPDGKYLTMIAGKTASIGDGMLSIWRIP
jgi:WD40 repeat protein